MNNQIPNSFMPNMPMPSMPQHGGCQCQNELRRMNERIDRLERQLRMLERKVNSLGMSGGNYPTPLPSNLYDTEASYGDNYMI